MAWIFNPCPYYIISNKRIILQIHPEINVVHMYNKLKGARIVHGLSGKMIKLRFKGFIGVINSLWIFGSLIEDMIIYPPNPEELLSIIKRNIQETN